MTAMQARRFASGALFGASLTAAGVYSPAIIIGQMSLESWHMLQVFLGASGCSALYILLFNRLSSSKSRPPTSSSLNIFSYDGNILGGLLLGFGMALTGTCPGSLPPQLAQSIASSRYVLGGAVGGGVAYSLAKSLLSGKDEKHEQREKKMLNGNGHIKAQRQHGKPTVDDTLYYRLGTSNLTTILLFEFMCAGMIAAVQLLDPVQGPIFVSPITGGLLVGLAQLSSLLLRGETLGISGIYSQIGDTILWFLRTIITGQKTPRPKLSGMPFAFGALVGSWMLGKVFELPVVRGDVIKKSSAVVGGFLLILGAKIAGGCTSGHGISGMAQMSVASIITVAAMFGGGVGLALGMEMVGLR